MYRHTGAHILPSVVGLPRRKLLDVFSVTASLEGSLEILVRSLMMFFLCDLEFPIVEISHRHRVGDVNKYFAVFFFMRK